MDGHFASIIRFVAKRFSFVERSMYMSEREKKPARGFDYDATVTDEWQEKEKDLCIKSLDDFVD
jgi:hypothetical protein